MTADYAEDDEYLANLEEAYGAVADRRAAACSVQNLPDSFWSARPLFGQVRQAAYSRLRSPDAVLAGALARVAAVIPPSIVLPAIVGSSATLDVLIALVGASGAGKTTATSAGRELLPIVDDRVLLDFPVGSGEGLVDAYLGTVEERDDNGRRIRVRRQVHRAVLAVVDEGQVISELGSRRGSTLMPVLRSAWSGQTLGQGNATVDTNRRLDAGSYRLAAIIAFQPEHAVAILDDVAGGTPQRIKWLSGTDPSIPDQPPAWPGPLNLSLEHVHKHGAGYVMDVNADVAAGIRARALSRSRGQATPEPLDSHLDLCTLKIAGLLAIIDGRLDVDIEDWRLAQQISTTSRRVRTVIDEHARSVARRREDAANERAARRDAHLADSATSRAIESMARSIARKVHNSRDPITRREATHSTRSSHRQLAAVDEAIDHAVRRGWITVRDEHIRPGESRPT